MADKKMTIIGLGLIGGSLAKALRERLEIRDITAVTRNSASIDLALKDGFIERGFTEVNEYVWDSDMVFICTPINCTRKYIDALAAKVKPGCIITDVGSTKGEIIDYVNSMDSPPCFVGGHPMAGTEKAGYTASFSHLFENAYYILTPCKSTTEYAITSMKAIIMGIGGIPLIMDAHEHDAITARISHVPHIIASALVNMIKNMDEGDGRMQMLAAGGFRDITRIASSSPEIWESIVLSNKLQVEKILEAYINILENFRKILKNGKNREIYSFFDSAKNYRNSIPYREKSLLNQEYEITVDVVDKPGIIGNIATILGNNNINIKNINVSNSREFEQGCLRISLPDIKSANIAFDLLTASGYKVYKSI